MTQGDGRDEGYTEITVHLRAKSYDEFEGIRFENRTNQALVVKLRHDLFLKPIVVVERLHEEGEL